ncbi:MAG TPA: FAD binding domain-containing protein [Myxococcota bacterium]|nr:FAD binding domain-containing protein [Myxococcota bacterium]
MLPLRPLTYFAPPNLDELFRCLDSRGQHIKLMAGGTDLLPNLKHGLYDIASVVSLRKLSELKNIAINGNRLELGALVKLNDVAHHPVIKQMVPALSKASAHIASPQIRNMGTLGGNICLDTRCLYFNQTEFWRRALGYCLKKDGDCCHVVKTGKRCVAAASNDLATVLLSLNASVSVASTPATREMPLDDFYTTNGQKNNILFPYEVVTTIKVPSAANAGFYKLRHRHSVDFPLLSVAAALELDGQKILRSGRVVINALVAKPKVMDLADFHGVTYNRSVVEEIARLAESKSFPQTNISDDPGWRKDMVAYAVKQALDDAIKVAD